MPPRDQVARVTKMLADEYGTASNINERESFDQAIELSAEILSNVKFIQEKKLIGKYFEEISQDTGK
ncbi:hypothetical protein Bca52824_023156 [Brassica carinata]|uniref:eRF1/Pelota-like N-terminal domain-containing protein n=1 Tax=Brassica carinata TaxID=52824 RepID=A0A8X7VHZ3_BRACI|nr:hypothetical protein Bca52824_023156 [Brassica carinata]